MITNCPRCNSTLYCRYKYYLECPTCPVIFNHPNSVYNLPWASWSEKDLNEYNIHLPINPITLTSFNLSTFKDVNNNSYKLTVTKSFYSKNLDIFIYYKTIVDSIPLISNQPLYLLKDNQIMDLINTALIFS